MGKFNEFANINEYPIIRRFSRKLGDAYNGDPRNLIDEPSENLDEDIISALATELQEKIGTPENVSRKIVNEINHYLLDSMRFATNISESFGISRESAEKIVRITGYKTPPQIIYDKPSNIQRKLEKKIDHSDLSKIITKRLEYIKEKNKKIEDSLEGLSWDSIDTLFGGYLETLEPLVYEHILNINPNLSEVIRYFTTMANLGKLENVSPAIAKGKIGLIKEVDNLHTIIDELTGGKSNHTEITNTSFTSLEVYAHTISSYLPNCYGIRTEFLKIVNGLEDRLDVYKLKETTAAFFEDMDRQCKS